MALISAIALATILAVGAGLVLAAASSVAHDLFANVILKGRVGNRYELVVARVAALVIGTVTIGLAIRAQQLNIAFLVALAFAVAASANLPALVFNLFWRRFNTWGSLCSIYGGLAAALVLVFFSPVVSGAPTALIPDSDFAWFPLRNPGLISIPIGFLAGVIGTLISKDTSSQAPLRRAVRPSIDRRRCGTGRPTVNTNLTISAEDFGGADLGNVSYTECVFSDVDLTEVRTRSAVFDHCIFRSCRFNASEHENSAFIACEFKRTSFFTATLTGCKLSGSTFVECRLTPLTVHGGVWRGVSLRGAELGKIDLTGVDLRESDLSDADFTGAILRNCDLSYARLRKTVLTDADLTGAQLHTVALESALLLRTEARYHRGDCLGRGSRRRRQLSRNNPLVGEPVAG